MFPASFYITFGSCRAAGLTLAYIQMIHDFQQGVIKTGNSNTLVFRYKNQRQESKKSHQCNRDGVICTSHFHMWYLAAFLSHFKDLGQAGSSYGLVWCGLRTQMATPQVDILNTLSYAQVEAVKPRPQTLGFSGDTLGHWSCVALSFRVRSLVWPLFWPQGLSLLQTR